MVVSKTAALQSKVRCVVSASVALMGTDTRSTSILFKLLKRVTQTRTVLPMSVNWYKILEG